MPMPRNNPGDIIRSTEWNELADQIDTNTTDIADIQPKLTAPIFPYLKTTAGAVSLAIQAAFNDDLINIGDAIQTAAYHEGSDLGGCTYRVVAAATGTDDGGSFISFDGFQLQALFGGVVDLACYGATPDRDDNQNPINSASFFSAIKNFTLPAGVYPCESAVAFISPDVSLAGAGKFETTITFPGGTGVRCYYTGSGPTLTRFEMRDIGVEQDYEGGASTSNPAHTSIAVESCPVVVLENVASGHCEGASVFMIDCGDIEIDGITLANTGWDGIQINTLTVPITRASISKVDASWIGDDVIAVHTSPTAKTTTTVTASAGARTVSPTPTVGDWVYIQGAGVDGGIYAGKWLETGKLSEPISTSVTDAVMVTSAVVAENVNISDVVVDMTPTDATLTGDERASIIHLSGVAKANISGVHGVNASGVGINIADAPGNIYIPSTDVSVSSTKLLGTSLHGGIYGANPGICGIQIMFSNRITIDRTVTVSSVNEGAGVIVIGSTSVTVDADIIDCGFPVYSPDANDNLHCGGVLVINGGDSTTWQGTPSGGPDSFDVTIGARVTNCEPSGVILVDPVTARVNADVRNCGVNSTSIADAYRAGVLLHGSTGKVVVEGSRAKGCKYGFSYIGTIANLVARFNDWNGNATGATSTSGTITASTIASNIP